MYFLFSGEGATDLGVCANQREQCEGDEYLYGPMTVIVDQVVEKHRGFSLLETSYFGFVAEREVATKDTRLRPAKKGIRLPGKGRAKETHYFFANARNLARIAIEKKDILGDEVVAILFRDCDGTASAGRGLWNDKWQSMLDGFAEEGFSKGVPMIPKPKSEAWLLCAVKLGYQGCEALEERSGNDDSPNSLKKELANSLGETPTRETLCQLVEKGLFDADRVGMASFRAFYERLREVI